MTGGSSDSWVSQAEGRRAQLVLLAAIALAVALVPLVGAYLQLGYSANSSQTGQEPAAQAVGTVDWALHDAASSTTAYDWGEREAAVRNLRAELEPTVETLRTARLADGITYGVRYNQTRATNWVDDNCPSGPNRQFGPCSAEEGVAVQERGGTTHTLAVAVDIEVTTPSQETTVTTVVTVQTA